MTLVNDFIIIFIPVLIAPAGALQTEICPSGCVACVDACPAEALKPGIPPALSSEWCILCSACREACMHDAVQFVPDEALRKEI